MNMSLSSPRSLQPVSVPSGDMYASVSRPAAEGKKTQPQNTDLFQAVMESRQCEGFFKQNFMGQGVASKRLGNKSGLLKSLPQLKDFLEFMEAKFQGVNSNQQDFLQTVLAQGDGARRADFNQLVGQVDPDLPHLHADLNKINREALGVSLLGLAFIITGLVLANGVSPWCFLMVVGGGILFVAAHVRHGYHFNLALKGKEGLIDKAWGHFAKTLHQPSEVEGVNVDLDDKALAKQLNCFFRLSPQVSLYRNRQYEIVESQHNLDAPSSRDVDKRIWVSGTEFILLLTQLAEEFRALQQGNTNAETF